MLRDYKSTTVGSTSHEEGRPMERNSNDWHGQRRKFQTFTETRIFRHVKIHEHVRWNRSFRGGKFPRKREEKEGRRGAERYVTHKILRWKRHLRHLARTKVSIFLRVLYSFLFFLLFFVWLDGLQRVAGEESTKKVRELFLRKVARYLGNI